MCSQEALTVNGQRYERWEEIRVTREIDRMATDFNIAVSERFLGVGAQTSRWGRSRNARSPSAADAGADRLHRQLSARG